MHIATLTVAVLVVEYLAISGEDIYLCVTNPALRKL